jgi:hypothetical protein
MSIDDNLKTAREGMAVLGEVIKAAGDNPDVKAAGKELGKTALTITKTINNALLPLAAVNFAFEKARAYFAEKFQGDLAAKAGSIPADQVVEPKASIAGPALQGLAFAHEEPNLKEMYLSLLASAMDGRVAASAHPAFVEIIRQMDSEEASLIRGCLQTPNGIPIAEIRLMESASGNWGVLYRHLLNLHDSTTKLPTENPRLPAFVDNWVRLGLAEVDYTKYVATEKTYDWVEQRPEFQKLKAERETETHKVQFQRGIIVRTSLGEQFAATVGILVRRLPGNPRA